MKTYFSNPPYQRRRVSDIPYFLYLLVGFNVLVFLLVHTGYQDFIIQEFAKNNEQISNGEWYRLLTSGFIHIDLLHIFLNMYSLVFLWQFLIQFLSETKVAILYLVAIVGGSFVSWFLSPELSIGASGGVFGLMGAAIGIALLMRQKSILNNLLQVVIVNIAVGLLGASFIDNWAHIGGLITGFALVLHLVNWKHLPNSTNTTSIDSNYNYE